MARVFVFSTFTLPSRANTCGTVMVNLPGLTGIELFVIVTGVQPGLHGGRLEPVAGRQSPVPDGGTDRDACHGLFHRRWWCSAWLPVVLAGGYWV